MSARARKNKTNKKKRRPRPVTTPEGTGGASPWPAVQPTERQPTEQPNEPATPGTRWAPDDPDATWWDDVWPFKDEPEAVAGHDDRADAADGADSIDVDDVDEADVPPRVPVSVAAVPPSPPVPTVRWIGSAGPSAAVGGSRHGRAQLARRIATGAALLGAAAIVGTLAWVTTRPSPDVSAELAHGNQYQPPHGLQADTSFVRTRIGGSGVEQVTHWIHTAQAVRSVQLRIPQVPGLRAGDVYVMHVLVAGDGVRLPLAKTVQPARTTTIALPPTRHLYLRYHLAGAVDYSGGSHAGALARITTLDVSTSRTLIRTTVAVTGVPVLALACDPPGPDLAVPCGRQDGGTWRAFLGPDEQGNDVSAQVDLS
jgi:hypothetical protein